MMNDINGRAVLITGASTGIGAAVAERFAALGARVALHYNQSRQAAEVLQDRILSAGGNVNLIQGDLADPNTCDRVVHGAAEKLDGIDILINNAGTMCGRIFIADAHNRHYDRVMDINARSVYACCHAVLPLMRSRKRGNIINVTSIAARNGGGSGAGLYASAKGFVSTFTRALAKEEAGNGIRVNGVAPGTITTPFHERDSSAAQLEMIRQTIPLGRLGTAEDCVGAFIFLASEQLSSYVTGQVIEVNGGQLMP
ncbi:MAG: SDR family NAD(P)-dependent oxidoreductase [Desulfuromonadales bacterium]|jgi:3-oxoacyl-[acyl-carrier protein] reductase|nr:SDR family NAD(P)-dependent oxidoreductase [Desulfuromonadales bacterium]